jgi:glycosyltransferase involved in cell wall biosynthesis
VVAVHNGLDAGAFLASRDAAFQLPDRLRGVPYILAVATFEHKKGLDVLVEAFARVSGQFPGLQLVLAGGEGPERSQIEALAAARGLADRIHIFVNVPHARIPAFMESARLFVLPSRIEPFGLVLVEAGAFSLPVIATRVGGIPEIIQHGVSGSLVRSEDPEDLASAIRESMSFPERAQSMGAALRESVSSRFSWDRAAEHYLRVAVAASGRRNRPAT